MPLITAIELENFQSLEKLTRIEFRPLTLMYGPNSAGKSAVFDAIDLLRVLLDPVAVDEAKAKSMINRWARRTGEAQERKLFIAVEFAFQNVDTYETWDDAANWKGLAKHSTGAMWYLEEDYQEAIGFPTAGQTVRIEMTFGVREVDEGLQCCLISSFWSIGAAPILRISPDEPSEPAAIGSEFSGDWWVQAFERIKLLEIYEESGFLGYSIAALIERNPPDRHGSESRRDEPPNISKVKNFVRLNCWVEVGTSPLRFAPADRRYNSIDVQELLCINAMDIAFYFGTMLWKPHRERLSVVKADRRSPRPEEALTVVDLGLKGWWSTSSMSPSSPAALLRSLSSTIDDHFQGLAEAAHAELLLRTARQAFWGGSHAEKYIREVEAKAKILEQVNYHLEKSLFTEKLYRVECASTLMVPIDLSEDDPWSYYALAQPSAVRLFLRGSDGAPTELQDVGSGVSYVLPVLHALARQGFVMVQQPELHLHPALQAAIADVFVEERTREGFSQVLIETHSEHLLLRLLRRIRETENGKALTDDVKLTNEDLAVYYFDPHPSGGTVVSRQLITPLGDFYNEWPRGFFAERYRDLFDE